MIDALDRSDARVRMLIGGLGYGKTTLCEQWAVPCSGRAVGWFRARRSAADVSVVARALVSAADEVVPGAGSRLLQRLAVTDDPEREATLLAEMLAGDLAEWPERGWIVIDDYQYLAAATASETFVETIVSRSPVQLLVAGEGRPAWVAARDILAGTVLELPEAALAMTAEEVEQVLDGGRPGLAPGLLALTQGWPAVIGLAGMTPDAREPDAELPDTLYDFFAEELFRALDPTVRTGLAILAEMPLIDHELAAAILGPERAQRVCNEAKRLGIFDERDGYLELHALAASFLERHMRSDLPRNARKLLTQAGTHYRVRGELDAAFDVAERTGAADDVDLLVSESMHELLDRARLPTLELWVSRAASRIGETDAMLLAQAEIALRQGNHLTAQALSDRVRRRGDESLAYRAYLVGAKAAHVGGREHDALHLFRRAEEVARDEQERRLAKWGQLAAAIDLELDLSQELMRELQATIEDPLDATESIQAADKRLLLGLRFGAIESLPEAKRVAELLPSVSDPVLRCSFGSTFSCALNLSADYRRAAKVARAMIDDATEFRVDFALPYGYLMQAAALAGLRRFDEAHQALAGSLEYAARCADNFGQQAVYAGRIRALLHESRVTEACALEPPDLSESLPAMRGEVWASRGLALACMGRVAEARRLIDDVHTTTRAIEPTILRLAAISVAALKVRDPDLTLALRNLIHGASNASAVDFVVTAYRASPDMLAALLRDPATAEATGYIVARASDEALVESIGMDVLAAVDPVTSLSVREREIYDMLCEGLANAEIARRLFISPATVKVHVRHVFDKLGIRSRTALALNAASRRRHPSATAAEGVSVSSDEDG